MKDLVSQSSSSKSSSHVTWYGAHLIQSSRVRWQARFIPKQKKLSRWRGYTNHDGGYETQYCKLAVIHKIAVIKFKMAVIPFKMAVKKFKMAVIKFKMAIIHFKMAIIKFKMAHVIINWPSMASYFILLISSFRSWGSSISWGKSINQSINQMKASIRGWNNEWKWGI